MRLLRKTAYLIALLMLLSVFFGCAADEPEQPRPVRPYEPSINGDIEQQAIVRYPLTIITKRSYENECEMLYPFIVTGGMDTLNISVYTAFADFRAECGAKGGRIEYSTEFNRYGLLSLLMTCTSGNGKLLFSETANFNTDTGLRVRLSDCFGASSTGYRDKLSEAVRRYAEANSLTFISEEPAFDDSTQFLFTFGGLDLVFREYEVFTAEAGSPRIRVRCAEAAEVIGSDGLLNRVK